MSDVADVDVQVLRDCDLVVTRPYTGEQATYRKDGMSPVLVLTTPCETIPTRRA
jgi:hypothetical protein